MMPMPGRTGACAGLHAGRTLVALLLVAMTFWLGGCKQVLYGQLGEHEANEMLAALAMAGLDVEKHQTEKHWAIEVAPADMPMAMQVLSREGLPRNRYSSLADLFKREALVATPTEERVRFIYGMSQELARTLSMIDGVLAARVHIVLPQNDPLADRAKPSSASVFIRHRAEADLQRELTAIRSLVVRSIEGLTHDNVYVSLFAADRAIAARLPELPVRWMGLTVSRAQAELGRFILLTLAGVVFILSGLAYWWLRRSGRIGLVNLARQPGVPHQMDPAR